MSAIKPPTMQRSRGQLATAYAPHSLFTFEGGIGACMALSASGNRPAELRPITQRMIGEQLQEYFEAWFERASRGQNLQHPVPPALAVDQRVLSGDAVRIRIGDFTFQIPESVAYIPFPLAFECSQCKLYRECTQIKHLSSDVAQFHRACPNPGVCADDWQQIDVVLTHWSGDIEALSPRHKYWAAAQGEVKEVAKCTSCESERYYLRRPPGPMAGWHFECVQCHTVRPILQKDRRTLELLGPLITQNQAILAEVNMEPISYRASAAYYVHGDRLLVFDDDQFISLLGTGQTVQLEGLLANIYSYPPTTLDDNEKQRLLTAAGRASEWENYAGVRALISTLEGQGNIPPEMIQPSRNMLLARDAEWNATVFAGHQQAAPSIGIACNQRNSYIRRFDPIRMAVEHQTLAQEKLHGGQLSDGKDVSVDVTILDPFLRPDGLSESEITRMLTEVRRRRDLLGIAEMRLIRDVKVCEYTFAYTRTSSSPTVKRDKARDAEMPVRLTLFDRVEVGEGVRHPVLCLVQSNEGLYVRLDEETVLEWLTANNIQPVAAHAGVRLGGRLIEEFAAMDNDADARFSRFLDEYRRERAVPRHAYTYVYTLLHTMAHHLIGVSAAMSGLDLGSFGEHIFAPDLAFLIYRRGMTMDLGNISSMWRDRGDPTYGNEVLERMVNPASLRCGSESVCNHRGGACPDCILIPENACLTRNELLSRSLLTGRGTPRWDSTGTQLVGYYEIARRRANA